jgi:hypothetical protein
MRFGRRRHGAPAQLVLISQCAFFVGVAVCIAITPTYLTSANEGGLSNYGVHRDTVVPYTLAFLCSSVLLLVAAHLARARASTERPFRRGLRTVGWLALAVLVSTYPYKVDSGLRDVHIVLGIALIATEVCFGLWLAHRIVGDAEARLALGVLVAGAALAVVTLAGVLHLLFTTQLVASLAFAYLVVRASRAIDRGDPEPGDRRQLRGTGGTSSAPSP